MKPAKPTKPDNSPSEPNAKETFNSIFAGVEKWGVRIGVPLIVAGLVVYVTGIVPPLVSIEALTTHWGNPALEFARLTGHPVGWGWTRAIFHGDMLALMGLIWLICLVAVAYVAVIPHLIKQRDRIYLVLVVLQLLVFAAAAGGWLVGE